MVTHQVEHGIGICRLRICAQCSLLILVKLVMVCNNRWPGAK